MTDRGKPGSVDLDDFSKRLESWKEIASFLDRSPRTVRRWERDEGLPVHRHQHSRGSTVFAYEEELEHWLVTRVERSHSSRPPLPAAAAVGVASARSEKPTDERPADEQPIEITARQPVEATLEGSVEPSFDSAPAPPAHRVLERAPSGGSAFRLVAVSSALALVLATAALYLALHSEAPVDPLAKWIHSIPVERRLLLEASYFAGAGDHEEALAALEAVAAIAPIGAQAVKAGLLSCEALGEPARCARLARLAADQSPDDAVLQAIASRALSAAGGGLDESLEYGRRALAASASSPDVLDANELAFVELLPARKAWLDGDVATSAAEMDRLERRAADLRGAGLDAVARAAGQHCLALGRIECARAWFARIADASERYELESYALFAAGRMEALADHLKARGDYRSPETAILLAMTGSGEAASRLIDRLDRQGVGVGALEVARGGLDLIAGRPVEAGPKLAAGVAEVRPAGTGMQFIGLDMLSRMAEKDGDLDRAAELLEMTDRQRGNAAMLGSGLFWIKCQTRLAEVYRGMGRVDDALRVERELLTALALSDPDHPTTAALKRRSA